MSADERCQARSRLSGGQCVLPAGHTGEHSVSTSEGSHFEDLKELWIEPSSNPPLALEELLGHLHDLIIYARAEGFARVADLLTVARSRIMLDQATYQRSEAPLRDLPPLE